MSENNCKYDSNGRLKYHPDIHPNHKKPWSIQDQNYLIDFYGASKPNDISLALGRTVATVMDRACDLRKRGLMK